MTPKGAASGRKLSVGGWRLSHLGGAVFGQVVSCAAQRSSTGHWLAHWAVAMA